jgi:hypothetical protein
MMKYRPHFLIKLLLVVAVLFLLYPTYPGLATTLETTSPGAIMLSGIDTTYASSYRVEVIGIFFWPAAAAQTAIVRCNSITGPIIFKSEPDDAVAQYMPLPGLMCKPVVYQAGEGTYNASSFITIFIRH